MSYCVTPTVAAGNHPEMWIVFIFGILGAVLTCFYMTRQIFMVFFGKNRKELIPEEERHGHSLEHMTPKESPAVMLAPLVILAIFALGYGGLVKSSGHDDIFNSSLYSAPHFGGGHAAESHSDNSPVTMHQGGERSIHERSTIVDDEHLITGDRSAHQAEEVGHNSGGGHAAHPNWIWIPQLLALLAVIAGIASGYMVFFREKGRQMKDSWKKRLPKLYDIVYNKYYCDEYIQVYLVDKLLVFNMFLRSVDMYIIDGFVNGIATLTVLFTKVTRWFDQGIIDGMVNGVAAVVNYISRALKYMQSGYVQNYYMLISLSVIIYLLIQGRSSLLNFQVVFEQVMRAFKQM